MRRALFPLVCVILASCAVASGSKDGCGGIQVSSQVSQAKAIVIGETHGTQEVPRAAGDVVCQLAQKGAHAVLVVEMPRDDQLAIDKYLDSEGSPGERTALLKGRFWSRPDDMQDGRSSEAMFELLERIRTLRKSGRDVSVLAIDLPRMRPPHLSSGDYMSRRSELMGAYWLSKWDSTVKYVAIIGSAHAVKNPGVTPRGPTVASVVGANAISLLTLHRGGTSWMCLSGRTCQSNELAESYGEKALDSTIQLTPTKGYDGVFYVGPSSASQPAKATHDHQ